MKDTYDDSLRRVLAHEGGYTNHPSDPGGPTNWGITIHDARMYWKRDAGAEDVRAMPKDVAKRIYKSKYWDVMRCDELPAGVDYAVFDFGVNSGISRSLKFLERIAGVPQDGKPDDLLIRTVANLPAPPIITELCDARLAFLKRLNTWTVFGAGWGRRVAEVKTASLKMASGSILPPPKPGKPSAKTEKPGTATKPIVKSKTFWASVTAFLATIWGAVQTALETALTDWRVWAAIVVLAALAYIVWERNKRPDIRGLFR